MSPEQLVSRATYLMLRRQPTRCNRFLLYADRGQLGLSVLEHIPRSAWVIKSLSADEINNGPSRSEWYRICDTIFFLEEWGLLS